MLCCECGESLVEQSKRVYACKECSPDFANGNIIYWCKACKDSTEHEHKRSKYKGIVQDEEDQDKTKPFDALQEYYDLDCEDVIAGGTLKTRFKYTNVPKENYGLTEEEILLLDDRALNKIISLKNLRPYKNLDDNGNPLPEEKLKKMKPNAWKVQKIKQEYREELDQKRKLVREN